MKSLLEDIVNSIMKSLKESFPNYRIYFEDVEQGFKAPCFLVNLIDYNIDNLNENERAYRKKEFQQFQVIFFPEETNGKHTENRQITITLPTMCDTLSRIVVGNRHLRADTVTSTVVDNTGQVLVGYNVNFLNKISNNDYMETLKGDYGV